MSRKWLEDPPKSPELVELERKLALAKPIWDSFSQAQKDKILLLYGKMDNIGEMFYRLSRMSQAEKKKD